MGRKNYLVEGVSGSGKSAVCQELSRRGYQAINGDRELAYQGDPDTGAVIEGATGAAVHDHHVWRVSQVEDMAADQTAPVTFFCGGSRNFDKFIQLFDEVFVLTVDIATLRDRLDSRPSSGWVGAGRTDERALVERLHTTGPDTPAGTAIDATQALADVVDEILARAGLSGSGPRAKQGCEAQ
jgi:hypothetical protein